MAVSTTNAVKAARLDAISSVWGTTPKLRIYTTPIPADVNAAATGTVIVEVTLAPASAGGTATKNMLGSATSAVAGANGIAAYYRVWNSGFTTAFEQGTVGTSGADLIIDNTSISAAQTVNFNSFVKTEP